MKRWKWPVVILGLVIAFSGGWAIAKLQDANKVAATRIFANRWVDGVITLVNQHGDKTEFVSPEDVRSLILSGIDIDSLVLGDIYDDLSEQSKRRVEFYLPAARALVQAPDWLKAKTDKQNLSILVECLRQAKSHGGSVESCVAQKRGDAD